MRTNDSKDGWNMHESEFSGFPSECVKFYEELRQNNRKSWFEERRADFEKNVMEPSRLFVHDMGLALKKMVPGIIADTRYGRSIFRPYRDTRFSHNKIPYKNHLGIFFWEGRLAKMDCPGFYFHLEPPILMLGVGNHAFSNDLLHFYRESVVDPKHSKSLVKAIQEVESRGAYEIGIQKLKQVPRGFDRNHENRNLLLFGGLTASCEMALPKVLGSPELVGFCLEKFQDMRPVHQWLADMNERFMKSRKSIA